MSLPVASGARVTSSRGAAYTRRRSARPIRASDAYGAIPTAAIPVTWTPCLREPRYARRRRSWSYGVPALRRRRSEAATISGCRRGCGASSCGAAGSERAVCLVAGPADPPRPASARAAAIATQPRPISEALAASCSTYLSYPQILHGFKELSHRSARTRRSDAPPRPGQRPSFATRSADGCVRRSRSWFRRSRSRRRPPRRTFDPLRDEIGVLDDVGGVG